MILMKLYVFYLCRCCELGSLSPNGVTTRYSIINTFVFFLFICHDFLHISRQFRDGFIICPSGRIYIRHFFANVNILCVRINTCRIRGVKTSLSFYICVCVCVDKYNSIIKIQLGLTWNPLPNSPSRLFFERNFR